ncbi:MAG: helix-turn-helix transcriptional regulator [Bacteroidetes bacterium]|jgi:transcriptional regulator with XRE-family HTH domain|nr:helix-turn-helix transcriptional regulator [Bacteroidota bacterium]
MLIWSIYLLISTIILCPQKNMGLKENLKVLRKKNGITQQEIAEYLGIDTTSYGRLERGERNLSADRLELIAKFYKVSVYNLLEGINIVESTTQKQNSENDFLEYLKQENQFLRNSIAAKDKQLDFLIELNKEYKDLMSVKKNK